jgi:hypothetical protein
MRHSKLLGIGNAKLRKTALALDVKILNFSLPRYKSETGKIICPWADDCIEYCYAGKGNYNYPSVQKGLERRYKASKQYTFINDISIQLNGLKTDKQIYIRLHGSGDFYSPDYIFKWAMIANNNPGIRFYAYTKSIELFNNLDYCIPENIDLIYSLGGKSDHLIDKDIDRHAKIFESDNDISNAGYINASYIDLLSTKWYNDNNKIGIVKH